LQRVLKKPNRTKIIVACVLDEATYPNLEAIYLATEDVYKWSEMEDEQKNKKFWSIVDDKYRQGKLKPKQTSHLKKPTRVKKHTYVKKIIRCIEDKDTYPNLETIYQATKDVYEWPEQEKQKNDVFWDIVRELYDKEKLIPDQTYHLKSTSHPLGVPGDTKSKMLKFFETYLEEHESYSDLNSIKELAEAFYATNPHQEKSRDDSTFRKFLKQFQSEGVLDHVTSEFVNKCRKKRGLYPGSL
jgi:hypothetical protein